MNLTRRPTESRPGRLRNGCVVVEAAWLTGNGATVPGFQAFVADDIDSGQSVVDILARSVRA